jgi:hypothetical protein
MSPGRLLFFLAQSAHAKDAPVEFSRITKGMGLSYLKLVS